MIEKSQKWQNVSQRPPFEDQVQQWGVWVWIQPRQVSKWPCLTSLLFSHDIPLSQHPDMHVFLSLAPIFSLTNFLTGRAANQVGFGNSWNSVFLLVCMVYLLPGSGRLWFLSSFLSAGELTVPERKERVLKAGPQPTCSQDQTLVHSVMICYSFHPSGAGPEMLPGCSWMLLLAPPTSRVHVCTHTHTHADPCAHMHTHECNALLWKLESQNAASWNQRWNVLLLVLQDIMETDLWDCWLGEAWRL